MTICNLNGISASNLKSVASKYDQVRFYLNRTSVHNQVDDPPMPADLFWALGDRAVEVGHSFSDFVIRCKFEDHLCNSTNFVIYAFSSFFNCYTFIVGRSGRRTVTQGIAAGLSLTLFLEPLDKTIVKPYDDNAFAGNSYGVRVLVNPPNSLPAAGVMGYDILAGHATYIAFDITERKRLPKPYSTCRGVGSMALGDGLAYSFTECKNICTHRLIRGKCGCFPTIYKVRRNYTALNETSCGYDTFKTENNNMMACQKEYLKDIETRLNYANDCNCHPPCEDIKYSTTLSQSGFPSENSMTSFWKTLLEQNPNKERLKAFKHYQTFVSENASMDTMSTWTQKHFLRLTVYANSKTVTIKQEIPMYTLINLLSQIGGCLGLWLGISIITIIEFFDLGFHLFHILCLKARKVSKMVVNHGR